MTRFLAIAAAAVSIAAVPVAAQETMSDRPQVAASATGGGSSPTAAPKKETRYCIDDSFTGSRMSKRVCRTKKEWLAAGVDPTQSVQ
jgi:hypothetical protein